MALYPDSTLMDLSCTTFRRQWVSFDST